MRQHVGEVESWELDRQREFAPFSRSPNSTIDEMRLVQSYCTVSV